MSGNVAPQSRIQGDEVGGNQFVVENKEWNSFSNLKRMAVHPTYGMIFIAHPEDGLYISESLGPERATFSLNRTVNDTQFLDLEISKDGKLLACMSRNAVIIWEIQSLYHNKMSEPRWRFDGQEFFAIAWAHSSQRLAVLDYTKTSIRNYDLQQPNSLNPPPLLSRASRVLSYCYIEYKDTEALAIAVEGENRIQMLDAKSNHLLDINLPKIEDGKNFQVQALFSDTKDRLFIGLVGDDDEEDDSKVVKYFLWDAKTPDTLKLIKTQRLECDENAATNVGFLNVGAFYTAVANNPSATDLLFFDAEGKTIEKETDPDCYPPLPCDLEYENPGVIGIGVLKASKWLVVKEENDKIQDAEFNISRDQKTSPFRIYNDFKKESKECIMMHEGAELVAAKTTETTWVVQGKEEIGKFDDDDEIATIKDEDDIKIFQYDIEGIKCISHNPVMVYLCNDGKLIFMQLASEHVSNRQPTAPIIPPPYDVPSGGGNPQPIPPITPLPPIVNPQPIPPITSPKPVAPPPGLPNVPSNFEAPKNPEPIFTPEQRKLVDTNLERKKRYVDQMKEYVKKVRPRQKSADAQNLGIYLLSKIATYMDGIKRAVTEGQVKLEALQSGQNAQNLKDLERQSKELKRTSSRLEKDTEHVLGREIRNIISMMKDTEDSNLRSKKERKTIGKKEEAGDEKHSNIDGNASALPLRSDQPLDIFTKMQQKDREALMTHVRNQMTDMISTMQTQYCAQETRNAVLGLQCQERRITKNHKPRVSELYQNLLKKRDRARSEILKRRSEGKERGKQQLLTYNVKPPKTINAPPINGTAVARWGTKLIVVGVPTRGTGQEGKTTGQSEKKRGSCVQFLDTIRPELGWRKLLGIPNQTTISRVDYAAIHRNQLVLIGGKRVKNTSPFKNGCECLDLMVPEDGWKALPSLEYCDRGQVAASLVKDKIYVFGGLDKKTIEWIDLHRIERGWHLLRDREDPDEDKRPNGKNVKRRDPSPLHPPSPSIKIPRNIQWAGTSLWNSLDALKRDISHFKNFEEKYSTSSSSIDVESSIDQFQSPGEIYGDFTISSPQLPHQEYNVNANTAVDRNEEFQSPIKDYVKKDVNTDDGGDYDFSNFSESVKQPTAQATAVAVEPKSTIVSDSKESSSEHAKQDANETREEKKREEKTTIADQVNPDFAFDDFNLGLDKNPIDFKSEEEEKNKEPKKEEGGGKEKEKKEAGQGVPDIAYSWDDTPAAPSSDDSLPVRKEFGLTLSSDSNEGKNQGFAQNSLDNDGGTLKQDEMNPTGAVFGGGDNDTLGGGFGNVSFGGDMMGAAAGGGTFGEGTDLGDSFGTFGASSDQGLSFGNVADGGGGGFGSNNENNGGFGGGDNNNGFGSGSGDGGFGYNTGGGGGGGGGGGFGSFGASMDPPGFFGAEASTSNFGNGGMGDIRGGGNDDDD